MAIAAFFVFLHSVAGGAGHRHRETQVLRLPSVAQDDRYL
jgi:hypothetical protein